MPAPFLGRYAARLDGEFAVFLIGARVNQLWAVHRWLPVALAMPRMLRELEAHPELGLLGYEQYFGRTSLMVQYWRSVEHLMDYAKARNSEHLPAWRAYNQRLRSTGAIGIWHETYVVRPGGYENIYGNMPAFGLGKVALRHGRYETVGGKHDAARARLDG